MKTQFFSITVFVLLSLNVFTQFYSLQDQDVVVFQFYFGNMIMKSNIY